MADRERIGSWAAALFASILQCLSRPSETRWRRAVCRLSRSDEPRSHPATDLAIPMHAKWNEQARTAIVAERLRRLGFDGHPERARRGGALGRANAGSSSLAGPMDVGRRFGSVRCARNAATFTVDGGLLSGSFVRFARPREPELRDCSNQRPARHA